MTSGEKKVPRGQIVRRYPALLLGVAAAALAVLLPSALNIPTSPPSTLSEFAPVPGHGEGRSDISNLGSGTSGGLGAGTGQRLGEISAGEGGTLAQRRPRLKRCVGTPPRQTEDPRSPPCVASFSGDNGGATTRGVTSDEVTVVLHIDGGGSSQRWTDYAAPPTAADNQIDSFGKALAAFFNDRYQTYGRYVHFWGYRGPASNTLPELRSNVAQIDREKNPFAILAFDTQRPDITTNEATKRNIFGVNYFGAPRSDYQTNAPHLISFSPDLEDQASLLGGYVCTKLAGRRARHAPSPQYREEVRKFGAFYEDDPAGTGFFVALKDMVKKELARCGEEFVREIPIRVGPDQTTPVTQMRTAGANAILTLYSGGFSTNVSQHAGAQQWYPEWIIGAVADDARNDRAQTAYIHNQAVWKGAYGITFDYRRGPLHTQPWIQAYREKCPGCSSSNSAMADYYDQFALLMYGIQAAGPRLTPQSFDKGLHAIPQRGSPDPYRPAAYFAPGNYSFIKDAMEIWWDPVTASEGDSRPGCYRIPHGGARFRASDWTGDDSQLFSDGPCQGVSTPPPGGG